MHAPSQDPDPIQHIVSPTAEPDVFTRVHEEFREMPGLTLTLQQAARLFGIEQARCERVLEALVDEGFLTSDGRRFGRADAGRGCA
jgi:hypothetical protein